MEMGYSSDQPICNIRWPLRLQTLTFGMTFNRPLQDVLLPATMAFQLQLLHFGSDFNHPLATANLPDQLEILSLGQFFQTRFAARAFAAIIVAPHAWRMLSVGTPSALLAAVRGGTEHQAAVSQRSGRPETLRKLYCDGDILGV